MNEQHAQKVHCLRNLMNLDSSVLTEHSQRSQRSITISSSASDFFGQNVEGRAIDIIFPLFDEMLRTAPQKFFSSCIIFFILMLQSFINGYFPFLPFFWNFGEEAFDIQYDDVRESKLETNPDMILRYFAYLIDFGSGDASVLESYIPSIILIVLSFFITFWVLFIVQNYKINKTFSRPIIFITRFIFSFILPFILIPTLINFMFYFNSLFFDNQITERMNQSACIVVTVLLGLSAFFNYYIFYFDIVFRSSTPYLENSCFSMWDGSCFFKFMLFQGLAASSSRLLLHFSIWTKYFLIALYCLSCCYSVFNAYGFPFIHNTCNVIIGAMCQTNLVTSILSVCPISSLIRLIVPIPLFIVSLIMYSINFKLMRKKIVKHPKIRFEDEALQSMRIVLADDPVHFVDWSLLRHIAAAFPTTKCYIRIAQVLAFFPSESQFLHQYVTLLSKHNDLQLYQRFLFYQIRRVHILRQSSANKHFNYEFDEVKKQTSKMIANFSQFFISNNDLSIGTLIGLVKLNKKTNSICLEALEKYPNSSRLAYEYSRYLIECHAQFKEGSLWHYKAELMDSGKHTAIDYSFRSMVNLYPVYLKKYILDYKGKKILKLSSNPNKESSDGHRSNNNGSSSSFSISKNQNLVYLDDEANEEEAGKIFDKPRLRFALKRAIDNMRCLPLDLIYGGAFLRFLLTVAVFLALYFSFKSFFNGRFDNTLLMRSVSTIREVIAIGLVSLCHLVGTGLQMIGAIIVDGETAEYDIFNAPLDSVVGGIISGVEASQTLGSIISSHGSSIIETAKEYMINGQVNYCHGDGTLIPAVNTSTRSLSYYLLTSLLTSLSYISPTMASTSVVCELIANTPTFQDRMDLQTLQFTLRESSTADSINSQLTIAFILVPIALLLLLLIPLVIAIYLLNKNLKKIFSSIMMLPKDVFIQSAKPIVKTDFESSAASSSIEMDRKPMIALPIVVLLSIIVSIIAIILVLVQVRETNNNFMKAAHWLEASVRRTPLLIEIIADAYYLVFFQIAGPTTYGNSNIQASRIYEKLNLIMKLNRDLLLGNDVVPACNGFSEELDTMHYTETCVQDQNSFNDTHASYSCLSVDQLMMVFSKYTEDLLASYKDDPLTIYGLTDTFQQLAHLSIYHLFPRLQQIQLILSDSCEDLIKSTNQWNGIILIVGFFIILILFIIELYINSKISSAYNTLKILLARFPPNIVISNQNLLDVIIGRSHSKALKNVSAAQAVIDSSPDAIFALSGDLSIESMNPSASQIFGYTPEQILGQPLTSIIPNPDELKNSDTSTNFASNSTDNSTASLYRQLALIKANQAANIYTCQAVGIKDDQSEVNLVVTVIGINDGQYFSLIANDQTNVLKQQREVEEAKKQAEKLLYMILPKDIVYRINRGEKDISFTVESATISFIDVVKFSDYMINLTPKQVLQHLGKYFKMWDDLIQRYSTIIKIKLIGDVYMVAAGLFNAEMPPSIHATEMLSFTIDGLLSLDDINHSLDANLSVRIGINTGGPIIAGVLGTDKPLFDIIGDPINMASRLQSTDIPNNVQISQSTYDLVKDKEFDIEQRGEVMLKGKGKQMAYLVHATKNLSAIDSVFPSSSGLRLPHIQSSNRFASFRLNSARSKLSTASEKDNEIANSTLQNGYNEKNSDTKEDVDSPNNFNINDLNLNNNLDDQNNENVNNDNNNEITSNNELPISQNGDESNNKSDGNENSIKDDNTKLDVENKGDSLLLEQNDDMVKLENERADSFEEHYTHIDYNEKD